MRIYHDSFSEKPMNKKAKRPLGRILLDGGFLSAQNLNLALLEQVKTSEQLGQILVRMGVLEAAEINAVLSVQDHLSNPATAVKLAAGMRETLGDLLVQAGNVEPQQLEQALAEQKRTGAKLGEIFVRRGMVSKSQLDILLDFQRRQDRVAGHTSKLRLGEILISAGYIAREQLDDALRKHKASDKKLGEVLVEEGYVKPHHVRRSLRIQHMLMTSTLIAAISLGGMTGCGSGGAGSSGTPASSAQSAAVSQGATAATELDLSSCARTITNGVTVIHVSAGVYSVSSTIELPSDTVLEGEGEATVLTLGTAFNGSQFITNSDFVHGNRNIVLRNLAIQFTGSQLDGDAVGIVRFYNVDNLDISNITMVVDSPLYAIDLSGQVQNATVEGCSISNANEVSGGCIMVRNSDPLPAPATSQITLQGNRVESVSDEPIAAFGWEGMVENVLIEQNTVCAKGASFGITAFGTTNTTQSGQIRGVTITGNDIEGGQNGAIGILGGAEDVVISENQVRDTVNDGIFLQRGDGPPIDHVNVIQNSVQNAGRSGIFADGLDVLVDQNDITNCTGSGVFAAAGVVVTNNVITNADPGILVDEGQISDIRGNSLYNVDRILIVNADGTTVNLTSN